MTSAPPSPASRLVVGYGAPGIALLVYLSYWLLFLYGPPGVYQSLLTGLGIVPWSYPFFDLEAVLLAIDCARQGIDVTLPNACMNGGYYQYSPLLLKAAALPIGAAQRVPFGLGLDTAFLLASFMLPRPRCWSEFWRLLLALLSTATLFAIERANIDVAIYLLVLAGVWLLLRGAGARGLGYAVVLVAAATKFYPAAVLVLAARERVSRFLAIALLALVGAGILAFHYWGALGQIFLRLPLNMPYGDIFSATNLPNGLAYFIGDGDIDRGIGLRVQQGLMVAAVGVGLVQVGRFTPSVLVGMRSLAEPQRMLLVAGAATVAFCFFAAKNVDYRQIFLILTLPGLWALQRGADLRPHQHRFRFASWLVIALLWSECLRYWAVRAGVFWFGGAGEVPAHLWVWAMREFCWWWLVSLLICIVLCFVWDAPLAIVLRKRLAS